MVYHYCPFLVKFAFWQILISMQAILMILFSFYSINVMSNCIFFSRPNSIYSSDATAAVVGHNTGAISRRPHFDRPPSALTSYSNFHGQRKPLMQPQLPNNHLTQESITNSGNQNHQDPLNSSFDDLPPPPPPLTELPDPSPANNPPPVPLQRNAVRRNEYVNMPIASSTLDDVNTQTLRADNHLLRPAQNGVQNGYGKPGHSGAGNYKAQPGSSALNSSTDDYGFVTGSHPDGKEDKWYLRDAMKPIGSPTHGGNCKCYRCQRKLTAI